MQKSRNNRTRATKKIKIYILGKKKGLDLENPLPVMVSGEDELKMNAFLFGNSKNFMGFNWVHYRGIFCGLIDYPASQIRMI